MLDRNELVLHRSRFFHGPFEDGHELPIGIRLRATADLGPALELGAHLLLELRDIDADLFEDRAGDAVGFVEESREEVQRVDLRVAALAGE